MPCGGTVPQEWKFGIDQRRQRRRRLDRRIERDAQLAQERQVGPEAGRDDDAVDHRASNGWPPSMRRSPQRRRPPGDALDGERRQHLQPAILHRLLGGEPERAALRQLVVEAAAEQPVDAVAAQRPEDLGVGRLAPAAPSAPARR